MPTKNSTATKDDVIDYFQLAQGLARAALARLHPPLSATVVDPATVYICAKCGIETLSTGDFPYCSYVCRCAALTGGAR